MGLPLARPVPLQGKNISTSGMRANFTNSIPVSVNTYNVPIMTDFSGPVQYEVVDRTDMPANAIHLLPDARLDDVVAQDDTDLLPVGEMLGQ